jgi:beta-phosphoglucomutase
MQKAIIFDLDGVIIDTENTVWYQSSVELMKIYDITHDEESLKPLLMGMRLEEGTKLMHDFYRIKGDFNTFLSHRKRLVKKMFSENVKLTNGFTKFIKNIETRNKAVATSINPLFLKLANTHLSLDKYFGKHIYSIYDINAKAKPEPDIFLHAAKMIDEKPENCIVLEDAPKGIEAAKRAGMRAIALTFSVDKSYFKHADHIADSFSNVSSGMLS